MWRIVMVLAAVGCSHDGITDAASFVAQAREAHCAHATRCGEYDDMQRCLETEDPAAYMLRENDRAALERGTMVLDVAAAERCLASFADLSCTYVDLDTQTAHLWACSEILVGRVTEGGTCTTDGECQVGSCFLSDCDGACCAGRCSSEGVTALAPLGASCAAPETLCVEGAYCDGGICVPRRTTGGACSSYRVCAVGYYCDGSACRKEPAIGEPCDATAYCADLGAMCPEASHVCVMPGKLGAACSATAPCMASYRCGADGRCEATPTTGLPCGPYAACVGDEVCEYHEDGTAICVPRKADGEVCIGDFSCQSGICAAGAEPRCAPDVACPPRAPAD